MAGADTAKVKAGYEDIAVPDELTRGGKFIKWEQDSPSVIPVTLKVDPKGYFLYWKDQRKDVDCLELAHLRDARNGKYAVVPKDGKVRDTCCMGAKEESLEAKAVTVVTGPDMVNISFVTFFSHTSQLAEVWSNELLRIAYSRSNQTPSKFQLLEKMYVKLTILVNREGKIPIKTLKKMLASSRDDKKRIEDVLQASNIHHQDGCIDPKKFTFRSFFTFYLRLVHERDVDRVFQELGAKNKPYLTKEQIVKFLNDGQRDPRLNEILYPYSTEQDAIKMVKQYEANQAFAKKGHLSSEGLAHYLMSQQNSVIPAESYILWQDMDQPLCHYFINSSHNTYLIGHQFTGKSSVEIYRQVLLAGCRCVELDCWDGQEEEPMITHGFTMCTEISFKEVIEAINEAAFKTSDYPVILSFENHCTPKMQAKMAHYCRTIFGDRLLVDPLDPYPLESGAPLPSPGDLKGKILIKNRKRKTDTKKRPALRKISRNVDSTSSLPQPVTDYEEHGAAKQKASTVSLQSANSSDIVPGNQTSSPEVAKLSSIDSERPEANGDRKAPEPLEEEESDSDDENDQGETKKEQGTAGQEAEAGAEMSALVNYLQPVHFHSFEYAEKNNKSFEITSFVETSAMNKVKEKPTEFVQYNKRQLSRIYPRGTRVDSSNYMPQIFWNVGCQLVALNFQTLDLPMQLNLGIFELNGGSGYLLKPDFMRRKERDFDPFAESTMDGVVAATLEIKVISGQFLSDKKIGSYVEIDMYGLPHDTVRKKHRTKVVSGNGLNPLYDDKPFTFTKVIMPKLAMLRISVYESSNNRMIGHRMLPVETLRPGYRHICLRNESNQVLMLPSLFVHIKVGDYVPMGLADFAEALSNPIAHISEVDRREKMLKDLADESDNIVATDGTAPEEPSPSQQEEGMNEENATQEVGPTEGAAVGTPAMSTPTSYTKRTPLENNASSGTPRKVSSKVPLGNKISTISAISMESSISLGRDSSFGLPRSTSLGNTQFEVFNGAFSNNKRSVSAPNLNPSEEIQAATVEDIEKHKKYIKIKNQQSAQLEKLIKKQEKKQSKLKKSQTKEINKLKSVHMKGVKGLEKKNTSQEKKETKKKNGDDNSDSPGDVEKVRRQSISSLENMKKEQEEEILKKQVHHEDILIELYRKHYEEEKHLRITQCNFQSDFKQSLMERIHSKQLKMLEKQQKKEEGDMRKMMEKHNLDQRRNISSADGDRHEIQRVRDEAKKKHIGQTVQFTKELRLRHVEKKDQLQKKMIELQDELSTASDTLLEEIEKEFDERIDKLVQERRYQRLSANENGDGLTVATNNELNRDMNGTTENHSTSNVEPQPTQEDKTTHAEVHASMQTPRKVPNDPSLPDGSTGSPQHSPVKNGSTKNGAVVKEEPEASGKVNGKAVNPEDGSSDTMEACSSGIVNPEDGSKQ